MDQPGKAKYIVTAIIFFLLGSGGIVATWGNPQLVLSFAGAIMTVPAILMICTSFIKNPGLRNTVFVILIIINILLLLNNFVFGFIRF